jgi:hypothetical protein
MPSPCGSAEVAAGGSRIDFQNPDEAASAKISSTLPILPRTVSLKAVFRGCYGRPNYSPLGADQTTLGLGRLPMVFATVNLLLIRSGYDMGRDADVEFDPPARFSPTKRIQDFVTAVPMSLRWSWDVEGRIWDPIGRPKRRERGASSTLRSMGV